MHAKTTIARSKDFQNDRIWLNGKEEDIKNPRLVNCLREIRKRSGSEDHVHICSENNFPTAAGLASSAAGYACLVYTLCQVFDIKDNISEIARQGSGSACRSIYGGFVQWHMGTREDGSDSVASMIKEAEFWSDLHVLILVVRFLWKLWKFGFFLSLRFYVKSKLANSQFQNLPILTQRLWIFALF